MFFQPLASATFSASVNDKGGAFLRFFVALPVMVCKYAAVTGNGGCNVKYES